MLHNEPKHAKITVANICMFIYFYHDVDLHRVRKKGATLFSTISRIP